MNRLEPLPSPSSGDRCGRQLCSGGRIAPLRLTGGNLFNIRRPVASPLNGNTYRPGGGEVVLTLASRFCGTA